MKERKIFIKTCNRCGYTWVARTDDPITCGNQKCRSPYWNKPSYIRQNVTATTPNAIS